MLLMGDEVRRTQKGNNNAYCHDSDISWLDWSLLEQHGDIHRFVQELNGFRQRRDVVAEGTALSLNSSFAGRASSGMEWRSNDRTGATTRILSPSPCEACAPFLLHGMLNAYWEPLTFELPPVPAEQGWRRCIDTALDSPDDICPWKSAPVVRQRPMWCSRGPWSFSYWPWRGRMGIIPARGTVPAFDRKPNRIVSKGVATARPSRHFVDKPAIDGGHGMPGGEGGILASLELVRVS